MPVEMSAANNPARPIGSARNVAFVVGLIPLLALDQLTKRVAFAELQPPGVPREIIGGTLRLTLVYNRDAAMNLSLGGWSRWGFATIAVIGIILLSRMLRRLPPEAWGRALAIGMVSAGAAGNLLDRLRWDRGVIDFIDVGLGNHRFWTFNVADVGVNVGAVLLAVLLSREGARPPVSAG
jgi:signal peptidase II